MRLPNREYAIIESEKLTEYLLNTNHRRGSAKARLLIQFGYSVDNWKQLEQDIRTYHLNAPVVTIRETSYGVRYEIRAALQTPIGRQLVVKTIWQIDLDQDFPRLITLIPE